MISKITNTLLKTKAKTSRAKTSRAKTSRTKSHKKHHHSIDKYCGFYKTDVNGKINKKLYNSCKTQKYCRKYKCDNIDLKMTKLKQSKIGVNYNKIIFDKLLTSCPDNLYSSDDEKLNKKMKKKCISKTMKNLYKDIGLEALYKKANECDTKICEKEQTEFNKNLFITKQMNLNKSQVELLEQEKLDVDADLVKNGDL